MNGDYIHMRFAHAFTTTYTHTKEECVRHILREVRHLLKKKRWQSKKDSINELARWIDNYDEADT